MNEARRRRLSVFREFLLAEASGEIVLMVAAGVALIIANSPSAETYFWVLHTEAGPLSVILWINDGLMALFFLLVGLENARHLMANWRPGRGGRCLGSLPSAA